MPTFQRQSFLQIHLYVSYDARLTDFTDESHYLVNRFETHRNERRKHWNSKHLKCIQWLQRCPSNDCLSVSVKFCITVLLCGQSSVTNIVYPTEGWWFCPLNTKPLAITLCLAGALNLVYSPLNKSLGGNAGFLAMRAISFILRWWIPSVTKWCQLPSILDVIRCSWVYEPFLYGFIWMLWSGWERHEQIEGGHGHRSEKGIEVTPVSYTVQVRVHFTHTN